MSEPVTPKTDPLADIIRDFAELSADLARAQVLIWLDPRARPDRLEENFWKAGPDVRAYLGLSGLDKLQQLQRRAAELLPGPYAGYGECR